MKTNKEKKDSLLEVRDFGFSIISAKDFDELKTKVSRKRMISFSDGSASSDSNSSSGSDEEAKPTTNSPKKGAITKKLLFPGAKQEGRLIPVSEDCRRKVSKTPESPGATSLQGQPNQPTP